MAEHLGGGLMNKTIPGIAALAMILASPVCYAAGKVPVSIGLAATGWAMLIGLASKMEEE